MNLKKTSFLLLAGLIFSPVVQVSAQAFQWAKNFGGTSSDEAYAVTVTNGNAIYVTGSFYDSGQFGPDNLVSAGDKDIYVARFDDSGNILWAVQAGGPADDRANDITADSLGNIYITGFFSQTATFGQYSVTAVGNLDLFVARYSPQGVCEWVVSGGSPNIDESLSICADALGNTYITGYFSGQIDLGSLSATAYGASDVLIASCSNSGQWQWVEKAGSQYYDQGQGISIFENKISVSGYYSNTLGDPAYFGNFSLPGMGSTDIFVAQYSTSGTALWAINGGGIGADYGSDISCDLSGNSYLMGYFSGTAEIGGQILVSEGPDDFFILKLDGSGNNLWIRQTGGTGYFHGNGICANGTGNVYVTGTFDNQAEFGDTTLTSTGYDNVFILKYDEEGEFQWAKQALGSYYNIAQDVRNQRQDVYVVGTLFGQASFDCETLMSTGGYASDGFITCINDMVHTGNPENLNLCAGSEILVPFNAQGDFGSDNIFSVQLSDLTGCFDNAIIIGTLPGTAAGQILCSIPTETSEGSTYRIRVVASNPDIVGVDNGSDLTIWNVMADAGEDVTITVGSEVSLGGNPTATGGMEPYSYSWIPTEGLSDPSIANPSVLPTGSVTYKVIVLDANSCFSIDSVTVTVEGIISCDDAIEIVSNIDDEYELQTFEFINGEMWYKFIPVCPDIKIRVNDLLSGERKYDCTLSVFSGVCDNLSIVKKATTSILDCSSLQIGQTYFINVKNDDLTFTDLISLSLSCGLWEGEQKIVKLSPNVGQGYLVLRRPPELEMRDWEIDVIERTFDPDGAYIDIVIDHYLLQNRNFLKFPTEFFDGERSLYLVVDAEAPLGGSLVSAGPFCVQTGGGDPATLKCTAKCKGSTYAWNIEMYNSGVLSYLELSQAFDYFDESRQLAIPFYQYMGDVQYTAISQPGGDWYGYYNVSSWIPDAWHVITISNPGPPYKYYDNQNNIITSPIIYGIQKYKGVWGACVLRTPLLNLGSVNCLKPFDWFIQTMNINIDFSNLPSYSVSPMPPISCDAPNAHQVDPNIPNITDCIWKSFNQPWDSIGQFMANFRACVNAAFGHLQKQTMFWPSGVDEITISRYDDSGPVHTLSYNTLFKPNGEFVGTKFTLEPGLYVFGCLFESGTYLPLIKEFDSPAYFDLSSSDLLDVIISPVPVTGNEFQLSMKAQAKLKFDYVLIDCYGVELYRKNFSMNAGMEKTCTIKAKKPITNGVLINLFIFDDGTQKTIKTFKM